MYYKIENNYPIISPIPLEGYIEYIVGAEPQELLDAEAVQVQVEVQAEAKQLAQALLSSTDWYVVRFTETGVAIPEDISQARAEARLAL